MSFCSFVRLSPTIYTTVADCPHGLDGFNCVASSIMGTPTRRMVVVGLIATLILLLTTAHYATFADSSLSSGKLGRIATTVGTQVQGLLHTGSYTAADVDNAGYFEYEIPIETSPKNQSPGVDAGTPTVKEPPVVQLPPATAESEKGKDELGQHLHVRPSAATGKGAGIKGCEYPLVIHVTPDLHCTGALVVYGSIVRNVLLQPKELQNKTCVHFTYVDPTLDSVEAMYRWPARKNPFTHVPDCAALDTTPDYNNIVPVRWQALAPIEKPAIMEAGLETWVAALNKVHSWGFDLYPRILILDADSIMITNIHRIFRESSMELTIAGPADQFWNCHDRSRINGGMILLRPSRYFHIVATELLYDPNASCVSGRWEQSEQELLNCICGFDGRQALRPEFGCAIMPLYNSIWPKNYGCSDANVVPMRSIHFTAAPKPWLVKEENLDSRFDLGFWHCVRDATRKGDLNAVTSCDIPGSEVTRKVIMEGDYV